MSEVMVTGDILVFLQACMEEISSYRNLTRFLKTKCSNITIIDKEVPLSEFYLPSSANLPGYL